MTASSTHAANPEKNYEAGGGEAVQKTPREVALCRARWITWRIGYRERRLLRLKVRLTLRLSWKLAPSRCPRRLLEDPRVVLDCWADW